MNLDQWEFYVLPTEVLNTHLGNQKTIILSRLKEFTSLVHFHELKTIVSQTVPEKVDSITEV